jgi:hypothetical protein
VEAVAVLVVQLELFFYKAFRGAVVCTDVANDFGVVLVAGDVKRCPTTKIPLD